MGFGRQEIDAEFRCQTCVFSFLCFQVYLFLLVVIIAVLAAMDASNERVITKTKTVPQYQEYVSLGEDIGSVEEVGCTCAQKRTIPKNYVTVTLAFHDWCARSEERYNSCLDSDNCNDVSFPIVNLLQFTDRVCALVRLFFTSLCGGSHFPSVRVPATPHRERSHRKDSRITHCDPLTPFRRRDV